MSTEGLDVLRRLFERARQNPRLPMNDQSRLTGKHCRQRVIAAGQKRAKGRKAGNTIRRGRKPFGPARAT